MEKIGMTSIDENGRTSCTVIKATMYRYQVRTEEVDGYSALQLVSMTRQKKRY